MHTIIPTHAHILVSCACIEIHACETTLCFCNLIHVTAHCFPQLPPGGAGEGGVTACRRRIGREDSKGGERDSSPGEHSASHEQSKRDVS